MTASYLVASITGENVIVVPDIAGACISCKQECAKRNPGFAVSNPKKLELFPGDKVKIGTFSVADKIRNFMALVLPALCGVGGYFLPQLIHPVEQSGWSDSIKAGSATGCLILGAVLMFCFFKLFPAGNKLSVLRKVCG